MLHKFPVVAMLVCSSGVAFGGEQAYTCEVGHVYSPTGGGTLETLPAVEKIMRGSFFSVSRETGALIGNSATLDTSLASSTRVINRGSKQNSFAAIADYEEALANGMYRHQYLQVEEFREGAVKPFVLMGALGIVVGTCK
jgi:hypothetical protein